MPCPLLWAISRIYEVSSRFNQTVVPVVFWLVTCPVWPRMFVFVFVRFVFFYIFSATI